MLFFTSLVALLLLGFFIKFKKKDIFEPFNLFALVMLSTLFITSFDLSKMQHDYGMLPIVFIFAILSTFLLGDWLGKSNLFKSTKSRFNVDKKKLKSAIFILFGVVVCAFVATWAIKGAPPLFSRVDRDSYYAEGIGLFYMLIDSLSFLIIFDRLHEKSLSRKATVLMLIAVLFMMVATSNKFQIFYLLAQMLILYNLKGKRIKLKARYVILTVLAVVGIFYVFYNFVYSGMYASSKEIYTASGMQIPSSLAFLTEPYLYIVYNFENLFYYIANIGTGGIGGGFFTLRKILESLGLTSFLYPNHGLIESSWSSSLQHSWLTTGTLFKDFYLDFGWSGICLGSLIIGFISGRIYKRVMNDKNNLLYIYLYTSCSVSLILAFMTNNFFTTRLIANILCMVLVYLLCRKKEVANE